MRGGGRVQLRPAFTRGRVWIDIKHEKNVHSLLGSISIRTNVNTVSYHLFIRKKGMTETKSWHGSSIQVFVSHTYWSEN